MNCPCRCHVYPLGAISCDVDTGGSGIPGVPSCSPCAGRQPVEYGRRPGPVAEPAAERAVVPPEQACALPHPDGPRKRHTGLLCGRHYHEIDGRLTEIETLFALRDELIVPGVATGPAVSGGGFGSPAPGRIELMTVTDRRMAASDRFPDVPGVLGAWVARLFEERGWAPPDAPPGRVPRLAGPLCEWRCPHPSCVVIRNAWCRPYDRSGAWTWRDGAWRLPDGVSWLVGKLRAERRWIAAQPDWIADYAGELRDAHRALATATGASMWAEPAGRCPNCGTKLFHDMTGADLVECRKCRASWSGVAWLRLRLIFEKEGSK